MWTYRSGGRGEDGQLLTRDARPLVVRLSFCLAPRTNPHDHHHHHHQPPRPFHFNHQSIFCSPSVTSYDQGLVFRHSWAQCCLLRQNGHEPCSDLVSIRASFDTPHTMNVPSITRTGTDVPRLRIRQRFHTATCRFPLPMLHNTRQATCFTLNYAMASWHRHAHQANKSVVASIVSFFL